MYIALIVLMIKPAGKRTTWQRKEMNGGRSVRAGTKAYRGYYNMKVHSTYESKKMKYLFHFPEQSKASMTDWHGCML